ncbi:phosphoenolpyruvate--protein phosphotransferase [Desulfobotulus sp.]|jgi:phosphotransferase system enzyme I (PtsI)|uniref:phosphoenolpyruvate--protein phosphotransferase n=1 Tax=Desulfobotulus sp. TaxID=1940337 RepID=UPI002A36EDA0|nr:phosphoenolpyruvate--protein phosphotransferase [Desulfobotulus sp.]MDY0163723.1 phosphoenolpyruvate--protein phosphotransferase [Desulfobotulus sp.]
MPTGEKKETLLQGISGAPGICIGKAYLVDQEGVDVIPQYAIEDVLRPQEVSRFKSAVRKAKNELLEIISATPEALKEHIQILETHLVLFKDKMLYGRTIETIETEGVNAEWALKNVVAEVRAMFQNIEDPYLQGRSADIVHVSERIMRNLLGAEEENISSINKRVILVANDLSPSQTSQIQLEWVMGFVTDHGGSASHTSIIARTLGIPCVLGLEKATSVLRNDDIIIVDGIAGKVIANPEDETLLLYEEKKRRFEEHRASISRSSHLPSITTDGTEIQVMGNIELAEEVVSVRDHGGDGIGLLRTEFLYLSRRNFPSEAELFDQYREVLELMAPAPVTFRTLDINGDKAIAYTLSPDEANPALGLRAIRFCLKKKEVFKTQLRAILRAAAFGNAQIMFPMISCIEEVREARQLLTESAGELAREKQRHNPDIPVGIMIEVPSAVVMADVLAREVDFFSIGTNDLVQYLLAIDRGNPQVAHLYNSLNPAVLRMIKRVVDEAEKAGISVAMCGEMAGDPFHLPVLMGLGIRELSMNPQSMPAIKNTIRNLENKDCRLFTEELLQKSSTQDVMQAISQRYGKLMETDFA